MSDETTFVQWKDNAKEDRKDTSVPATAIVVSVIGAVVVLAAVIAAFMYL